jgi:tRNA pseudouridine38-40 synthase
LSDRFLVAIGYHGHSFHGSQVQKDVGTVEGSLRQALKRLTWWTDGCLEMSSRTDAGVSVRMNLARIDMPPSVSEKASEESIIRALNDHLPVGATAISANRAPADSKVRYAESRRYLYRLEAIEEWPYESDPVVISDACSLIQGVNDFSNLCRLEEGVDPVRSVEECAPWLSDDGRVVGFSIQAKSFIWNQVRRVASAFSGIASGRIGISDLESALIRPQVAVDLGRGPSEGLVLWAISHADFEPSFSDGLPPTASFSRRPRDSRDYRRWLSTSQYEMGALLEREWLSRLN